MSFIISKDMEERLKPYLDITNKYKRLSRKDETMLIEKMLKGDSVSRDKLVYSNLKKVIEIALLYTNHGLEIEDLIQEGVLGLIKALDRFDIGYSNKVSTYAKYWIKQSINRAVYDKGRLIRLPVHLCETINKLKKAQKELDSKLNREPTICELSTKLGISEKRIRELLIFSDDYISYEKPINEYGETTLTILKDTETLSPEQILYRREMKDRVAKVLETLTPREKNIMRLRCGFDNGCPKTLEEIGTLFNMTRERIRQIEAKALRKLRHPNRSKQLIEYMEDIAPSEGFIGFAWEDYSTSKNRYIDYIMNGFLNKDKLFDYNVINDFVLWATEKRKIAFSSMDLVSTISPNYLLSMVSTNVEVDIEPDEIENSKLFFAPLDFEVYNKYLREETNYCIQVPAEYMNEKRSFLFGYIETTEGNFYAALTLTEDFSVVDSEHLQIESQCIHINSNYEEDELFSSIIKNKEYFASLNDEDGANKKEQLCIATSKKLMLEYLLFLLNFATESESKTEITTEFNKYIALLSLQIINLSSDLDALPTEEESEIDFVEDDDLDSLFDDMDDLPTEEESETDFIEDDLDSLFDDEDLFWDEDRSEKIFDFDSVKLDMINKGRTWINKEVAKSFVRKQTLNNSIAWVGVHQDFFDKMMAFSMLNYVMPNLEKEDIKGQTLHFASFDTKDYCNYLDELYIPYDIDDKEKAKNYIYMFISATLINDKTYCVLLCQENNHDYLQYQESHPIFIINCSDVQEYELKEKILNNATYFSNLVEDVKKPDSINYGMRKYLSYKEMLVYFTNLFAEEKSFSDFREDCLGQIESINSKIALLSLYNTMCSIPAIKEAFEKQDDEEMIEDDSNVEKNKETLIEDIGLSVLAYNCLRRAKVVKVADLLNKNVSDLLRARNLGRKATIEVLNKIDALGFRLLDCPKDKYPDLTVRVDECWQVILAENEEIERKEKEELLNKDISTLELSVRAYNCLKRANVHTIGDLVLFDLEKISCIRNLGRKQVIDIIEKLDAYELRLSDCSTDKYITIEELKEFVEQKYDRFSRISKIKDVELDVRAPEYSSFQKGGNGFTIYVNINNNTDLPIKLLLKDCSLFTEGRQRASDYDYTGYIFYEEYIMPNSCKTMGKIWINENWSNKTISSGDSLTISFKNVKTEKMYFYKYVFTDTKTWELSDYYEIND